MRLTFLSTCLMLLAAAEVQGQDVDDVPVVLTAPVVTPVSDLETLPPPQEVFVEPDAVDLPSVVDEMEELPVVPLPLWNEPTLDFYLRDSATTFIVADAEQFGMLSFESFGTLSVGEDAGITFGSGFHLLNGPINAADMPPRLFDLHLGFHSRNWIDSTFGYDVSVRYGVYTDFEDSTREGVRVTGHGLSYTRLTDAANLVLGVEYLDRQDVRILPVAGLILQPIDELRLELVFPRPKISSRVCKTKRQWVYISGELGGGEWAVERDNGNADLATYHDLRLSFGFENVDDEGHRSLFEIGYVFDRELIYSSGQGNLPLRDTIMFRCGGRF